MGISPLWLVIVALITWSLGEGYYPGEVYGIAPIASYALGLASALLLFASILAHEFGHALVARRRGVEIEEIDLWLLPLDGGRVARALQWRRSGDERSATDTAAGLGRAFGYLLIGAGFLFWFSGALGGLWFAVIGFFLVTAANAGRVRRQALETLVGISLGEAMSHPAVTIASGTTLEAAYPYFARHRYTAFPVTRPTGRPLGLMTLEQVKRVPRSSWPTTIVDDIVERDTDLVVNEREDIAPLLDHAAFQRVGRAAVLDQSAKTIGLISIQISNARSLPSIVIKGQEALTASRLTPEPSAA